jgi:meiotic recombination protein REC8, fungi type
MFYSSDILNKKHSMSVVWMAATLQKKLTKKQIQSVEITEACQYVQDPPEPLALRLSSNLMVGLSRVYSQQTGFLWTDVNQVVLSVKNAFRTMGTGSSL